MNKRCCFSKDIHGSWYLIDVDKKDLFDTLQTIDPILFADEFDADKVVMSIENYSFEFPSLDLIDYEQ